MPGLFLPHHEQPSRREMSEHSRGNAIDVTKIVLNNGKNIMVRKPGFFAFREKACSTAYVPMRAAISRRFSVPAITRNMPITSIST